MERKDQPTMWMDRQAQDYQSVLKDYQEQFNFFYCADKEVVKEYFLFKDAPDVIPFVALIDPKKREPLKKQKNALEKVSKLRGVRFDWSEQIGRGADIGLIAQEVEEVFPEIVTEKKRLKLEGLWKTVRYDALIGVLVEAIKELKAEVDELKKGK